jgi:hypothetical protein
MRWKTIAISFTIICIITLNAIILANIRDLRESFSSQLQSIKSRVEHIENTQNGKDSESTFSFQDPSSFQNSSKQGKDVSGIKSTMNNIQERLTRLEKHMGAPHTQQPSVPSGNPEPPVDFSMPLEPMPFMKPDASKSQAPNNSSAWLKELPQEKRVAVDEVFKEQSEILRERLAALSAKGGAPNPIAMREIIEENNQELKDTLKDVLDKEEYQKFLYSLPELPEPPTIPGG